MNGPTRRLAVALLAGFALLLLNVTYVQAIAGPRYRDDPRNERTALTRIGKERGMIVSADGTVLAESVASSDDPQRFLRRYPEGEVFAHAVGYTSLRFGDDAVEDAYADDLRSRRDFTISDLLAALLGRDLRPRSVQLTIDADLQRTAFEALNGQAGAVVALRPDTGEVLALVSAPSFDPNGFVGPDAVTERERLLEDARQPLLDRATGESYSPGSTFKVVVAAAAIEEAVAGPESRFPDPLELTLPGSTAVIRNFDRGPCGSGDTVTLREAFRKSCNTIFGQLAMDLGAELLSTQANRFGFNQEIPFQWNPLTSFFPAAGSFENDLPGLAQSGIGERDVQATPFQMALVASAVANQGIMMRPFLVKRVADADGEVLRETEAEIYDRAVAPATAELLAGMLEQVVTNGTGGRAAVSGVRVAGKTGTAQADQGAPDVWFIGFAPVDDPTIAVAVVIEDGGAVGESATGGSVAAPVAQRVLAQWLQSRP